MGRSWRSAPRARRSLRSATPAFRPRPCGATSSNSACRSTTSATTCRASAATRSRRSLRCRTKSWPRASACRSARCRCCAAPATSSRRERTRTPSSTTQVTKCHLARKGPRPSSASASCASARTAASTTKLRSPSYASSRPSAATCTRCGWHSPDATAVPSSRRSSPRSTATRRYGGSMRLYDTYTRRKQELPPAPGPIRTYFCGPTVYARAHIGNARPFVIGMWLRRWLLERGYDTVLVHNITDINDKIYDAAPGASADLALRATEWYLHDTADFGLGMPDEQPKASELIPQIVAMIEELVLRGYAYEVNGDVYYRVSRFAEYGRLSGQRPDSVEDQEPNPRKEDPRDFALWKANKPGEDTWWDSPWGRGRPGWHIECSAMSEKYLGEEFEIHGGGLDLVFPHHENEIAQSRALGHPFARLWMHNGMLSRKGEEMHKSLGNAISLKTAIDRWGRET